jgi:hypothetical protein
MDGFLVQAMDRLPLAEAALTALRYAWDDPFLIDLFDQHRGRCYVDQIDFPTLVHIIREALLRHRGSAHKSIRQAIDEGQLQAACSSTYQKLSRTPLAVSTAFLRESTARLCALLPEATPRLDSPLPDCLGGFEVIAFDGKTLKYVTRRLKALRGIRGKMLGGKLLVGLNLSRGVVLAMNAEPDAFRNDAVLVDGLLKQLPPNPDRPRLFIADRQFCDLRLMALIADQRHDHFIIRYNHNVDFVPDPDAPARKGIDAKGRRFIDQSGWLGASGNKKRRRARRITLLRPGQEEIAIMTDLMDPRAYPPEELLEAYLARWGIEQVFQQVTEVFSLNHLIGTTPKATIFQAAFCFVLYNVIQLIKTHIADAAQKELQQISTRKLFDDLCEQLSGCSALARGGTDIVKALHHRCPRDASANRLRKRLRRLLANVWTDWWIKAPTRPRPPTVSPKRYAPSGRASVHRVLEEYQIQHKLA